MLVLVKYRPNLTAAAAVETKVSRIAATIINQEIVDTTFTTKFILPSLNATVIPNIEIDIMNNTMLTK